MKTVSHRGHREVINYLKAVQIKIHCNQYCVARAWVRIPIYVEASIN